MTPDEIKFLLFEIEFEMSKMKGIPAPGTRKWYLIEFTHWVLGEILAGRNPIPD